MCAEYTTITHFGSSPLRGLSISLSAPSRLRLGLYPFTPPYSGRFCSAVAALHSCRPQGQLHRCAQARLTTGGFATPTGEPQLAQQRQLDPRVWQIRSHKLSREFRSPRSIRPRQIWGRWLLLTTCGIGLVRHSIFGLQSLKHLSDPIRPSSFETWRTYHTHGTWQPSTSSPSPSPQRLFLHSRLSREQEGGDTTEEPADGVDGEQAPKGAGKGSGTQPPP